MKTKLTKMVEYGDWQFDVKMISAHKIDEGNDSPTAVANLTIMGDTAYVDGQLSSSMTLLTKKDYAAIYEMCRDAGIKHIVYDRYKNGVRISKCVDVYQETDTEAVVSLIKPRFD